MLMAQDVTAEELLNRAIAYHDPNNNWKAFKGALSITMQTANSEDRVSDIIIDIPGEYFNLTVTKDSNIIEQTIRKDSCSLALNGSTVIPKKEIEKFKLDCSQARKMKDYYTYLYGLPMKLKDPGTLLDPAVYKKSFNSKEYLVLKVNYEAKVGSDTWYFYFDPVSYTMEMYQFFHDETKNDGEYIVLSEEEMVMGIKMPKIRKWYYNKDDGYLGTDTLTKATGL